MSYLETVGGSSRLVSLWDMLKHQAQDYIRLGELLSDIGTVLYATEAAREYDAKDPSASLSDGERRSLRATIQALVKVCKDQGLTTSAAILVGREDDPPKTRRELDILAAAVKAELASRLFLAVPQHVSSYWEWDGIVSDAVVKAFGKASEEIRQAGNALACGLHTACVFHSMRAAEIGVRALATALGVVLAKPIELAEWQEILNGITPKIRDIENLPNTTPTKDADLLFYNEAAAQFRFFKNGWRIRVMHARATYDESQAKEAIDHVRSFFETLAKRLKE